MLTFVKTGLSNIIKNRYHVLYVVLSCCLMLFSLEKLHLKFAISLNVGVELEEDGGNLCLTWETLLSESAYSFTGPASRYTRAYRPSQQEYSTITNRPSQ